MSVLAQLRRPAFPVRRRGRADEALSVLNPDGHVVGLDIGATAVRATMLSPVRAEDPERLMTVADAVEAALPPGTVVEGVVRDPAALTRALVALWKAHDIGCRRVIVGVSNSQVVVRAMQMPRLRPDQFAQALPFQAREVVALPMDQALLDFRPLPTGDESGGPDRAPGADAAAGPAVGDRGRESAAQPEGGDTVDGLLIAAPRQPVLTAVRAVEAAGLHTARVDLCSFAALRAVAAAELAAETVVDIGAQVTNIVVHRYGVPRVVRTVGRGGQQLTERLVERTGAGQQEAEILKREVGLLGSTSEATMILASAVRPLVSDIRSSVQYFSTTNSSLVPERLTLTGGGADLPGLAELLTADVGVPCRVASPLRHVRTHVPATDGRHRDDSDRVRSAATAVSVGLALGAAA